VSIDWNAAVATAKTAIDWPADTYKMSIDGASWDKTKTGKDRLKIRMLCKVGPKTGKFLFWDLVLTPDNAKALKFFLDRLNTLGVSADKLSAWQEESLKLYNGDKDDAALEVQKLIAAHIRASGDDWMVTVEVGDFNGQPQTEVRKVVRA
jgi:hypothetical protein